MVQSTCQQDHGAASPNSLSGGMQAHFRRAQALRGQERYVAARDAMAAAHQHASGKQSTFLERQVVQLSRIVHEQDWKVGAVSRPRPRAAIPNPLPTPAPQTPVESAEHWMRVFNDIPSACDGSGPVSHPHTAPQTLCFAWAPWCSFGTRARAQSDCSSCGRRWRSSDPRAWVRRTTRALAAAVPPPRDTRGQAWTPDRSRRTAWRLSPSRTMRSSKCPVRCVPCLSAPSARLRRSYARRPRAVAGVLHGPALA